ncbi:low molecular weight protein-tyrosine-phosphatase [soil metagenome]
MLAERDEQVARVLFVCLGNICRSPMAEGVMRAMAADRGITIAVDSAGTGDWHVGQPPDRRAIATALAYGVDIGGLRGRQVDPDDFHLFTHVVAMDLENFQDLRALQPANGTARLLLLLDHLPGREGEGVTDPYFGGDAGFETVWQDIAGAVGGLLDAIARDQRPVRG